MLSMLYDSFSDVRCRSAGTVAARRFLQWESIDDRPPLVGACAESLLKQVLTGGECLQHRMAGTVTADASSSEDAHGSHTPVIQLECCSTQSVTGRPRFVAVPTVTCR